MQAEQTDGEQTAEAAGAVLPPKSLKGFWLLFVVQFQGAFSDNFFKFLVIFFAGRGVATEVREHFGQLVCKTVIPRTVRLSEAPSFGQPIILYDLRSPGAQAYLKLMREVVRHGKESARARA